MATTGFIAGLLVAFFGAAIAALLGQFLRYYRRKRENMDTLISVIKWINSMEREEVAKIVDDPNSHIWKLHDSLYDASEANRQFLNDEAQDSIRGMFSVFASMKDLEQPHSAAGMTTSLGMYAFGALDEIEQVGVRQCAKMFFWPQAKHKPASLDERNYDEETFKTPPAETNHSENTEYETRN